MSKTQQLAQKVIYIRGRSSFTQEEIANKLGVSRQSWILVEKGQRDLNTEELKKLSEIFGVDIVDFFKETPNIDKFKQMYFACIRLAADEQGGIPKTKLAKLLYLVDFSNFFYSLESMSGIKYRRMQYGPVAEAFFSLTEDLYEGGDINIQPVSEALIISATTKEQATDKLKPKELKLIKTICSLWKNKRTMEIVNFTHQQKPWKMCREGEYIPYELIIQEDPEHVYQPFTRQ
ncbi:MAG: DUF4065 domain-containing protein [Candidatus Saccharibacteria bacterium]|nr:DUF4065 domain-containing protein [Candidatus Saccharibacteria bacterium]